VNVPVDGTVAPGFEGVRAAFEEGFRERGEVGAALVVHLHGETVVDLWGGHADVAREHALPEGSLHVVFSATKGLVSAVALVLAQRGVVDLDAPVSRWWPELRAAQGSRLSLRHLLSHQAGLPVVDATLTLDEVLAWEPVIHALEQQEPRWALGAGHGYHAMTFGWLVGEVLRRATGQTIGELVRVELAEPLGIDVWIGSPDDVCSRVHPVLPPDPPSPAELAVLVAALGPTTDRGRSLSLNGLLPMPAYGRPEVLRAEIPSANGVASARGLSRFYAALVGAVEGVDAPLLTASSLEAATTATVAGEDRVLSGERRVDTTFGAGFALGSDVAPWGRTGSFGHPGAAGALGFADPAVGLALGYIPNRAGPVRLDVMGDARGIALARATYQVLDDLRTEVH